MELGAIHQCQKASFAPYGHEVCGCETLESTVLVQRISFRMLPLTTHIQPYCNSMAPVAASSLRTRFTTWRWVPSKVVVSPWDRSIASSAVAAHVITLVGDPAARLQLNCVKFLRHRNASTSRHATTELPPVQPYGSVAQPSSPNCRTSVGK